MTGLSPSLRGAAGRRLMAIRVRSVDRVTIVLGGVLVVSAGFYLWTAGTAVPLSLHDGLGDRYNLLASALIHFRLSIGPAPAALLHLTNPYDPRLNGPLLRGANDASSINDDVLYHGRLYFEWGPAPALVLLVPLHLLGFEPSASVTVCAYAVAGLGFALATLRLVIRQIGDDTPIWMCTLAGFAVSLSCVLPYLLRTPSVSEDILAGGYCFVMAGVWLAASALAGRKASQARLVLMSLCFGLAANSRPTLALSALVLIPVYLSLRSTRSRRALLSSLALPVGICFALFLAYNQARFHSPLEVGARYQLAGYESSAAPLGHLSYVLPGIGFYMLTPPRLEILFPFINLVPPQFSGPAGLARPEITGGLLAMAPIVGFVAVLPWIWRRRPLLLGRLAAALLILAAAGIAIPLLPSYQFFAPTERYEVDFATLLVLGGVAAWLSLSNATRGKRRRLLRVGGGALAAWGCATGLAVSFYGSGTALSITHPQTWRTLEDVGSPLSTAIAAVLGHPVLAAISAAHEADVPPSYTNLGSNVAELSLSTAEQAAVTVVSPSAGKATLAASVALRRGTSYEVRLDGPGHAIAAYPLPAGGGLVELPVTLDLGLNHLTLRPIATSERDPPATTPAIVLSDLSIAHAN